MNLEEGRKKFESNQQILKHCRCCMKSDKLENMVFIYDGSNKEIVEMFRNYTSFKFVRDDELPEEICTICMQKIIQFLEFCLMCEKSDTAFREHKLLKCATNIKQESEELFDECEVVYEDSEELYEESEINVVGPTQEQLKTVSIKSKSDNDKYLLYVEPSGQSDIAGGNHVSHLEEPILDLKNIKAEFAAKSTVCPWPQCNKKIYCDRLLEVHLRQHQDGKEFSKSPYIDRHNMLHTNAERKSIHDEPNYEKSYTNQSLSKHKKREHSKKLDLKQRSCYKCDLCDKSFAKSTALKKHSRIHSRQHKFKCTHCSKRFTTNQKLKEHTIKHEVMKCLVCSVCGMEKRTTRELKIHMNYHTRDKLYPCKACTVVFSSSSSRLRHVKTVHIRIKEFQCSYCARSFGRSDTLKDHVATHTGQKPHVCSVCGKCYMRLCVLQKHMETHNK